MVLYVRYFSTSVVRPFAKLVRVYGIEGRYATALYSAASKQKKLEQVEKELPFGAAVATSEVSQNLLGSLELCKRHGPSAGTPLEETTLSELKTVLKSFLSQGQILKLEVKTDPSIMGGMIVRIGEKYVDMSAKTKIQKLSKAMREVI
ncbi:ATP synthase subunit O, mitochondrial [Plecturocebus cupreus]